MISELSTHLVRNNMKSRMNSTNKLYLEGSYISIKLKVLCNSAFVHFFFNFRSRKLVCHFFHVSLLASTVQFGEIYSFD